MSDIVKKLYPELSEEEILFIDDFKYRGKTHLEWEEEVKIIEGLDEDGNPAWYEPFANVQYGLAFARTMLMIKDKHIEI